MLLIVDLMGGLTALKRLSHLPSLPIGFIAGTGWSLRLLPKFYARTIAITGQSVSRTAGAHEETGILPQPTRPTWQNWSRVGALIAASRRRRKSKGFLLS